MVHPLLKEINAQANSDQYKVMELERSLLMNRCLALWQRASCWVVSNKPLVVIVVVGLVPLTWFKDALPISYYDGEVPIPPFYAIERYWHIWDAFSAPGMSNPRKIAVLPLVSFFYFSSKLGLPLYLAQAILIVALNIIAGVSIYAIFNYLSASPYKRTGALFAALFYINNMFVNQIIWAFGLFIVYVFYTLLPLLIFLYIKGLRSGRFWKYASLTVLVSLGISPIASDLPYLFPLFIIAFSYSIYSLLVNISKATFMQVIRFNALVVGLAALLHAWWWMPLGSELQGTYNFMSASRTFIDSNNLEALLRHSSASSFLHLFQTLGSAPLYQQTPTPFGIETWLPYAPVFMTPVFIGLSFLIPLVAFIGIITFSKERPAWYFFGLFALMLFLAKGAHQPLGSFFVWLVRDIPGGSTLRGPFNKFGLGLAFSYAFVIGLGAQGLQKLILKYLSNFRPRLVMGLIMGIIAVAISVVYGYLYWSGEIIPGPTALKGGARFRVPSYYSDAENWLKAQGSDFRVLVLPLTRLYYGAFDWEHGYWGVDPSIWLFSTPTIARVTDTQSYTIPLYIAEQLTNQLASEQALTCLAGLLNVRYILLHEDTSWRYVRTTWWVRNLKADVDEYKFLLNSLNNQDQLRPAATIGKLHFYENLDFVPHTYLASRLTYLPGGLPQMTKALEHCDPHNPPAIFLSDLQPEMAKQAKQLANTSPPSIGRPQPVKLVRLNSSKYQAYIHNEAGPITLVFGESYNPAWEASINGNILKTHLSVNGYANAWVINQTGDFTVNIQFSQEKYVVIGSVISILGLILSSFILMRTFR